MNNNKARKGHSTRAPSMNSRKAGKDRSTDKPDISSISSINTGNDPPIKSTERLRLYDLQFEIDVSSNARLVWGALVKHIRSSLACYVGRKRLCDLTRRSDSTVERSIEELKKAKLLYVIPRGNVHGRRGRSANVFILNPPKAGLTRHNDDQIGKPNGLTRHNDDQIDVRNNETADTGNKLSQSVGNDHSPVFDRHYDGQNLEPKTRARAREAQRDPNCPECGRQVRVERTNAGDHHSCVPECGYSETFGR